IGNLPDERLNLRIDIARGEVRTYAVAQILRLPDVQDLVSSVVHPVHARPPRQRAHELLGIEDFGIHYGLETCQVEGARDHLPEHLSSQHTCRGVVTTAMIRVDQIARLIQRMFPPMREHELTALQTLGQQDRLMSNPSQCQHDPYRLERSKL